MITAVEPKKAENRFRRTSSVMSSLSSASMPATKYRLAYRLYTTCSAHAAQSSTCSSSAPALCGDQYKRPHLGISPVQEVA